MIKQSKLFVFVLLETGLCFFLSAQLGYAEERIVELRSGTPVLLKVFETISSEKVTVNQDVRLIVIRDVKIGEDIVIKSGADGFGKITKVKKKGGWGKKGEFELAITSAMAIDGSEVLLSAQQRAEGSGKGGEATAVGVGTGLLCLPLAATGFLVKGEEGAIPAGTEIKAYVDGNYNIKLPKESTETIQSPQS